MKQKYANARSQRLSAAQRLIETHGQEPPQKDEIKPKQQHRAKTRYMVEPLELKVAHG